MKQCSATPDSLASTDPLSVPAWAARLVGDAQASKAGDGKAGDGVATSPDGRWSLVQGRIANADRLCDAELTEQTQQIYPALLDRLATTSAPYPVRAWNVVPGIHHAERTGRDRYMAFNAGRHAAYATWFGDHQTMATTMPTASAVGWDGSDLGVCILGHAKPGEAIENPRQVPAFRYSARFGTVPPSFVRATVLPATDRGTPVLVAGTASVTGEDSRHPGDLTRQLTETFRNLATVLLTAAKDHRPINGHLSAHERSALGWYESARVYVRHPGDLPTIRDAVARHMPRLDEVEWVRADICRSELLVEIEGVALLPIDPRKPSTS